MRGRIPKPGELREAQGNPGRRPIPDQLADDAPAKGLPFAELSDNARRAYEIISGDLRRMNFVRASDESLLLRYCDAVARYWKVTKALDAFGDETYEAATVAGGVMQRMRPQFVVQQLLSKRLEAMEDRLGLSPMARQQYMIRMAATGATPNLFPEADMPEDTAEAPRPSSPVGFLRSDARLN
ncbi:MAG TPA: phage terminase small subunit P27 family [Rhizomicrobium sp.]|nr:phage terminase small subunit P27 family [Rhizomicrobium sp.]